MVRLAATILTALCLVQTTQGQDSSNNAAIEVADTFAGCIANLKAANSNNDANLTTDEFMTLIKLQSNCTDEAIDRNELTAAEEAAYRGLVSTQCSLSELLTCAADLNRTLSIAGIDSTDKTQEQVTRLEFICTAVSALLLADCIIQESPIVDDLTDDLSNCSSAIVKADTDGSLTLTRSEYNTFLEDYNGCDVKTANLTNEEELAFASLACVSESETNCQSNPDATITFTPYSADDTVNEQSALIAICTTSKILGCGFEIPPIGELPINSTQCFTDMTTADSNGDKQLDYNEFKTFVMARTNNNKDCNLTDASTLTSTQEELFTGFACTSCMSDGNSPDCCDVSLESKSGSIAGAGGENVTYIQQILIIGLCGSIDASCSLDGGIPSFPTPGIPPSVSPPNIDGCVETMTASDANDDGFLSSSEFYEFVLTFRDECFNEDATTDAQQAAFLTAACASCIAAGESPLCCANSYDDALVTIPKNSNDTIALALCISVAYELDSYPCGPDGAPAPSPSTPTAPSGGGQPTTPSAPSSAEQPSAPSPAEQPSAPTAPTTDNGPSPAPPSGAAITCFSAVMGVVTGLLASGIVF